MYTGMLTLYRYVLLGVILFCCGCSKIEYSPNQVFDAGTPTNLNRKNIEKLNASEQHGTIRIAFIGDSQRYYDEAAAFKDKVNSMEGVDFVILAGDISDFGLRQEMEWIHEIFSQIRVPYLAVIGNHDLVAKGEEVYRNMFGPTDFSFVYKRTKFIFHNTNGREYNFNGRIPDTAWLQAQCREQEGVDYYVGVSHVPAFDMDFDPQLRESYAAIFRHTPGFLVSLNGHLHQTGDSYPFNDSVRYINSNAVVKREFLLLEIAEGRLHKTMVDY